MNCKHLHQNIYGNPIIGEGTTIRGFCGDRKDVVIGKNCKIQAFVFIPEGVEIGDNVFIGPHVCFTNCTHPKIERVEPFSAESTLIEDNVIIGAGSIILPGVVIGRGSFIGAGSLISKDVPAEALIIQTRETYCRGVRNDF